MGYMIGKLHEFDLLPISVEGSTKLICSWDIFGSSEFSRFEFISFELDSFFGDSDIL